MRMTTASTCCYCGVGCGVLIEHDGANILGVAGDPQHPANFGRLCTKGSTLHLTGDLDARALHPELRLGKSLPRARTTWDSALEHAAQVFADTIERHGPDSVAFYVSGQLLSEDYYAFNKLARALVGTNNIDSNSRLCMSSAVVGYKRSLGADAPPCSYEDIELSDCVLIAGSNMAYTHPVLFRRLEEARARRPEMKVIVIDPRRTDTCELADLHLAIQPGTDVALFHGLLHILLREGWSDRAFIDAHTEGFAALADLARDYSPQAVAALCGISIEDLETCARLISQREPGAGAADTGAAVGPQSPGTTRDTYAAASRSLTDAPRFLSLWCMGLNQSTSGSAKNSALINLHLATGQIGLPGAGPFSLTGQPNAMGGRETGSLANLLPGHREAASAEHRAEVAAYWGVEQLPANPGLSAIELFEAVGAGRIKALWIVCTNPAQSLPDQHRVHEALAACPFVVVQDAFRTTETCRHADLLLPAASWGEKEGTVSNSERRISHVRRAVAAPGEARSDWSIACDFARRLERRVRPGRPSLFAFDTAQALFEEYKALTAGRDLDYSGLSYELLDIRGPQQWPYQAENARGTPRLYTAGAFPTHNGRARLIAEPYQPTQERCDARYPLALLTGRLRDQWHGMSRTGTAARLFGHVEQALLGMADEDMRQRGLTDGQLVRLSSRRGSLVLPVQKDDGLSAGQTFLPMHWGDRFLKGLGSNAVTLAAVDPLSKQPELKHAAVEVEAVQLTWQFFALVEGNAQLRLDAVRPLLENFPYASFSLAGRTRTALLIRAAHQEAVSATQLQAIDRVLGLDHASVLTYDDPQQAVGRRIRLDSGRIVALRLAGATDSRQWLQTLWESGSTDAEMRRWLLTPRGAPTGDRAATNDPILCNCTDIRQSAVRAAIARGCDLARLKQELGCGSNCGSCVPELTRLLARSAGAVHA